MIRVTGSEVMTLDGKPEWMYGLDIEISELKEQEDALRKSQSLLNRTGEVAGIGGWEWDLISDQLLWTDETCRIHGMPPGHQPTLEEAVHFYTPDSRAALERAVQCGITQGKGWDLELTLIRTTGETIWVRAVGAIEFENNEVVRLVGAFQNVTESHRLRSELGEQQKLLRITLQSIADAVITTDARGQVVWLNPVAERMTGWSTELAHGRLLGEVFHIIRDLLNDELDQTAVRCFVEVARVVGLKTVAEFVDQPRILDHVREMGIDYAQG